MSAFFSYLFFKIPVVLHTNTTTITIKVEELRKVNDCNNTHISMRYGVMAFGSNPRSCRRNSWLQSFQEGLHLWSRRWSMCFFFKESIPCTRLDQCDQPDCGSMWISLRTHSLSRPMSSIILRVVYRSTADVQPENMALCDHIGMNLDQLLWHQANSLVIVVRDVNSTSTGSVWMTWGDRIIWNKRCILRQGTWVHQTAFLITNLKSSDFLNSQI